MTCHLLYWTTQLQSLIEIIWETICVQYLSSYNTLAVISTSPVAVCLTFLFCQTDLAINNCLRKKSHQDFQILQLRVVYYFAYNGLNLICIFHNIPFLIINVTCIFSVKLGRDLPLKPLCGQLNNYLSVRPLKKKCPCSYGKPIATPVLCIAPHPPQEPHAIITHPSSILYPQSLTWGLLRSSISI